MDLTLIRTQRALETFETNRWHIKRVHNTDLE